MKPSEILQAAKQLWLNERLGPNRALDRVCRIDYMMELLAKASAQLPKDAGWLSIWDRAIAMAQAEERREAALTTVQILQELIAHQIGHPEIGQYIRRHTRDENHREVVWAHINQAQNALKTDDPVAVLPRALQSAKEWEEGRQRILDSFK